MLHLTQWRYIAGIDFEDPVARAKLWLAGFMLWSVKKATVWLRARFAKHFEPRETPVPLEVDDTPER